MEFSLTQLLDAFVERHPTKPAIVFEGRTTSYLELQQRATCFARYLVSRGVRRHEGNRPAPWEAGHDLVAVMLGNRPEYLEVLFGTLRAGGLSANVNFRYVEAEVRALLTDMRPKVLVFATAFADVVQRAVAGLEHPPQLVQVRDSHEGDLVENATWYDEALAVAADVPLPTASPDDRYVIFTGGTTGSPKGVLWRQADLYVSALGGRNLLTGAEHASMAEVLTHAEQVGGQRALPAPPFTHGSGQWTAMLVLFLGGTLVLVDTSAGFDADELVRVMDREQVDLLNVVGDAFGRPLADAIAAAGRPPGSLRTVLNGGTALSRPVQDRLMELVPGLTVVDTAGASETGGQMTAVRTASATGDPGAFAPNKGVVVLDDSATMVLPAGHEGTGWLATVGRIPLGYLNDPERTRATFKDLAIGRVVIAGDRARSLADGRILLLGRESTVVNTGGEKVFVEEVEQALVLHPAVRDVIVVARPHPRWGNEIVALVALDEGPVVTDADLRSACSERLAGYKVPKAFLRYPALRRTAVGKPDYAWALAEASG